MEIGVSTEQVIDLWVKINDDDTITRNMLNIKSSIYRDWDGNINYNIYLINHIKQLNKYKLNKFYLELYKIWKK